MTLVLDALCMAVLRIANRTGPLAYCLLEITSVFGATRNNAAVYGGLNARALSTWT